MFKIYKFKHFSSRKSASKFKYCKFPQNIFLALLLLLIFVLIDFVLLNGSVFRIRVRGPGDWTLAKLPNPPNRVEVITAEDEREKHETTTNQDEELERAVSAIPVTIEEDNYLSNESYFNMTVRMNINSPTSAIPRVLTEPRGLCDMDATTASTHHPFLLMLVLSGYKDADADARRVIRETYGSVTRGNTWPGTRVSGSTALVFVLGEPPSGADVSLTATEQRQHGDLLIGDFVDAYRNLTLKVLFGLRWSFWQCARTRFVLKVDQDVFVNVPLLVRFLQERGEYNSVYGFPSYGHKVQRRGKWKVTRTMYPFSRYPTYMSGSAYVLSMDAVGNIINASNYFPPIPVEDAFFTGILSIATGIRKISSPAFTFNMYTTDLCGLKYNKRFVTKVADKPTVWKLLRYKLSKVCSGPSRPPWPS